MPLVVGTLESALVSLFTSPGSTAKACAQSWADAVVSYAGGIVPASTSVSGAKAALASALEVAFMTQAAAPLMETAFAAFAVTVGGGMAGYVPTPPPAPVGFAIQFAKPMPATSQAAAQQIAALIDTWLRTGLSALAAPPNTVQPWS